MMPFSVEWDGQHPALLRTRFSSPWNLGDLGQFEETLLAIVDEEEGSVDILIIWESDVAPPRLIGQFQRVSASRLMSHPRIRRLLNVGIKGYMAHILTMLTRFQPQLFDKVLILSSEDEALRLVETLALFE